jgi:hypothetical protein
MSPEAAPEHIEPITSQEVAEVIARARARADAAEALDEVSDIPMTAGRRNGEVVIIEGISPIVPYGPRRSPEQQERFREAVRWAIDQYKKDLENPAYYAI